MSARISVQNLINSLQSENFNSFNFSNHLSASASISGWLGICIVPVMYSKTCLKRPLKKKTKIGFQDRFSLNAGQKYCRTLQVEHSAILSTFINLPFAFKTFVLSIFEWLHKTGFTVAPNQGCLCCASISVSV